MKKKITGIFILILSFLAISFWLPKMMLAVEPVGVMTTLTCGSARDMWSILPVTHEITKNGNEAGVRLGFNKDYGGIGVKFELVNTSNGGSVNILEARSSAGCAWQYSAMMGNTTTDGYLINQAVGNNPGFQWGYSNDLVVTSSLDTTELVSRDLAPNPADTGGLYPEGITPCGVNSSSPVFDDGKPHVIIKTLSTSHGPLVDIMSEYSLKSRINQSWGYYSGVQALYLNRKVARDNNLRVYLIGKGWMEGPLKIYDDFSVKHATYVNSVRDAWDLWSVDAKFNPKKLLFVWSVAGKDIGLLVNDISLGVSLRLGKTGYCTDSTNDTCGSMDMIVTGGSGIYMKFPTGSERTYSFQYLVGTIPQLEEFAGEPLVPSTPCRIQGLKINATNLDDSIISSQTVTCGGINQTQQPFGFDDMTAGNQICTVTVPDGTQVQSSVCYDLAANPTCHETATRVLGNSAIFNCPSGGYADLWWHYYYNYLPGDLNKDNYVNIFDLRHFLSNFLQTFTIFDYNKLVENFGK